MNVTQKSEAIKNGLRKGFQDGSSKIAKRKCYGYDINPDGAPFFFALQFVLDSESKM